MTVDIDAEASRFRSLIQAAIGKSVQTHKQTDGLEQSVWREPDIVGTKALSLWGRRRPPACRERERRRLVVLMAILFLTGLLLLVFTNGTTPIAGKNPGHHRKRWVITATKNESR